MLRLLPKLGLLFAVTTVFHQGSGLGDEAAATDGEPDLQLIDLHERGLTRAAHASAPVTS